jgi:hypothetical protein
MAIGHADFSGHARRTPRAAAMAIRIAQNDCCLGGRVLGAPIARTTGEQGCFSGGHKSVEKPPPCGPSRQLWVKAGVSLPSRGCAIGTYTSDSWRNAVRVSPAYTRVVRGPASAFRTGTRAGSGRSLVCKHPPHTSQLSGGLPCRPSSETFDYHMRLWYAATG